ncbi:MAG: hypothetical protein Fur005_40150 [Roseiflexaceae bacterium]
MTMMLEEENDRLRAENAELRALVAQLQEQLAAAFVLIAELEQERRDPPPFVKPSKPARAEPKPPRKKRAARPARRPVWRWPASSTPGTRADSIRSSNAWPSSVNRRQPQPSKLVYPKCEQLFFEVYLPFMLCSWQH